MVACSRGARGLDGFRRFLRFLLVSVDLTATRDSSCDDLLFLAPPPPPAGGDPLFSRHQQVLTHTDVTSCEVTSPKAQMKPNKMHLHCHHGNVTNDPPE